MRATVQTIYVNILRLLGLYGLALLGWFAFVWSDIVGTGYAVELALIAGWLTLVISMILVFPSMGPRFLRRPLRPLHALPLLICFMGVSAVFGTMGVMVAIVNGLPPSIAYLTALPVLFASGMAAFMGFWMSVKRPEFVAPVVEDPVAHTPKAQIPAEVHSFQSRRAQLLAAE